MDQTFSIGDESGESAGQRNSWTFSVSRKLLKILATCDRALFCLNVGFHRTRINSKAMGRNTPEMQLALFKVSSMRTGGDQDVYPIGPHTITPGDEPIR
ncbi:hypothetical protein TNCV_640251 [Trichonephila clavipes]|nr:hypothetical protein TNCV_640251 [Trichonephila clavipes]